MLKSGSFRFWFVVFSVQMFIACFVPTAVLLMLPAEDANLTAEVSGLFPEAAKPEEMVNTLKEYYMGIIDQGEIILDADGKKASISYKAFDLQTDASKIYDIVQNGWYKNRYFQLIGKSHADFVLKPVVTVNSAKLREVLSEYKTLFHTDAENAGLVLEDGAVKPVPEKEGLEFNIEKAADYIKLQLEDKLPEELVISYKTTPGLFDVLIPELTEEKISSLTQVYGLIQVDIPSDGVNSFQNIINSIKKKTIAPGEVFSYRERVSFTPDSEQLHMSLASAIYRSVLPVKDIKVTGRKPAPQPVNGIEAGFEVSLDDGGDLEFLNMSDSHLALAFSIEQTGRWNVALVGSPGLAYGEIKTEKIKLPPPVIYAQDNSLPENAQEVKENGREGLSVKVIRVTGGESVLLSEDTYQPVYKIIAVGSAVKKEDIIYK